MDEVEVKIVDAPVGEALAERRLDVLGGMVGVPELGDDEELLARHESFRDCARDTLSALLLVGVVRRAVQKAVAGLDCLVHRFRSYIDRDLPQAETSEGHGVAGDELDGCCGRHC